MENSCKITRRTFNKLSAFAIGASIFPLKSGQAATSSGKRTDIRPVEASLKTELYPFRTPLKFGGRVVNDLTGLNVEVQVENRDGRRAKGTASMPVGNVWSWPGGVTDPEMTSKAMILFAKKVVRRGGVFKEFGHPLEVSHDFSACYDDIAKETVQELGIKEPMPKLAQKNAASPFDAALFDAYGKLYDANVHHLLSKEFCNRDLSFYFDAARFGDDFRGEYLDQYTLRTPQARMPLYHLVGALDPLTPADVTNPINDGLPEDLIQWIVYNGLTHLKIKLNGDDLAWDVARVLNIDRVISQTQRNRNEWFYSVDFNERCANVEYVLEFFSKLREGSPQAFERLQYAEQPTHRDLKAFPENKMHLAARIKPIVIDESLVDNESLLDCRRMGYSGIALKACKGHGASLLMGAAAQKYKMFLCVQDLTCPGASFLQSATLSARIPTVAAIEGNARQFCPKANDPWKEKYPSMFVINDGTVGTNVLTGNGLY